MYCTSKFLIYIFIFVSMTNEHRHNRDEQPTQVGTERGKTFFGSQFYLYRKSFKLLNLLFVFIIN